MKREKMHWTKKWKERMSKLEKDCEEYRDLYLRSRADFENYRRKKEEEWKKTVEFASERIVFELLPILDNLERALSTNEVDDPVSFKKGMEMIYQSLVKLLQEEGLEIYHARGEKFDPRIHEAITTVRRDDVPPGTVVEEFTPGYTFKGKVLRPARVAVATESRGAQEESVKGGK